MKRLPMQTGSLVKILKGEHRGKLAQVREIKSYNQIDVVLLKGNKEEADVVVTFARNEIKYEPITLL